MCEDYQFEDLQTVVAFTERHVDKAMKPIPHPLYKPLREFVDQEDFETVTVDFDNIDKIRRMLNLAIYLNIHGIYELCIAKLVDMSSNTSPQDLADKLQLVYRDVITEEMEEEISREIDVKFSKWD